MSTPHVVIVGGGPVGLSAALLLHRWGIRCTVLERDTEPSTHPKARGVRPRTMELFTQWGLAEDLRAHELADSNRFIYCDSLSGPEIARSPAPTGQEEVGPCRVSQDVVERVLRSRVPVRTGVMVTDVRELGDAVVVGTESGEEFDADYVIAADGVGSTVRGLLGIGLEGDAVLGYGQSIYWRGDLSRWTADRPCIQFVTGHRLGRPASIAPVDGRDRWVTMVMQPGGDRRPSPPTPEQAADIIRHAVGAEVDATVLDIATWRISAQVAERFRAGRVFLAGDAAHSFPPTGGFGMNTGVQDVHNLVWKLALVLRGEAGEALLDTYETERQGIARSNAAWSVANGDRMRHIGRAIADGDADRLAVLLEEQRGHVDATDQDLGFTYVDDRIGGRFPWMTLLIDGRPTDSITGLGEHFTLVNGTADGAVTAEAPIDGAVLIRPDGIVGWTGDPAGAADALDRLLRRTP